MTLLSAVLHSLLPSRPRRSAPLLLAVALLLPGLGQASPAHAERQRPQAEAMAKLSSEQRQAYFAALRQLEQRLAAERLAQLSQSERCLVPAKGVAAIETCQRNLQEQRREQRRRWMAERADLQRRFGLPGWNPRSQHKEET